MDFLKTILVEITKGATAPVVAYLLSLIPTKKHKKKTSRKKSARTRGRSSKKNKLQEQPTTRGNSCIGEMCQHLVFINVQTHYIINIPKNKKDIKKI